MTAPRSAQMQPIFCGITAVPGRGRYIENSILLSIFRLMDRLTTLNIDHYFVMDSICYPSINNTD